MKIKKGCYAVDVEWYTYVKDSPDGALYRRAATSTIPATSIFYVDGLEWTPGNAYEGRRKLSLQYRILSLQHQKALHNEWISTNRAR